jgi:hypothetical protein
VAAVQPESVETLAQQHAALLDPANPREAMLYPKGAQVIDIADKKAFGQIKLPDGRVVQYDKNGPSNFTPAKIRQYAKDDRLNEALQLGPVSKDEALSRVAAGETPAAVTERTPVGTEVKAAAGTVETAPAQAEALELSKTPGNVVGVERPEDVVGARQAGVEQPKEVVQPAVAVTPLGKPGRILEAQDEASIRARNEAAFQEAQQARTVQDQLKAKEAAKEAGVKDRSHAAKEDQAKVTNDNINAQRIVEKYPRQDLTPNWRNETYSRAKAMVDEAKQADITIPKTFPEGHPHSGAMLKLREAADLTATKFPKPDAYARFMDREHMIDTGREQEAFDVRRNEGAKGLGSPEGAVEGVRARGEAEEEPAFTAGKAAVGFKQEVRKSRAVKRQEIEGGAMMAADREGNPVEVKPTRTMTISEGLDKHVQLGGYSSETRPMVERLVRALKGTVGHKLAHFVSHDDLVDKLGIRARGYYDPAEDHIVLNANKLTGDTMLHEALHAATYHALEQDPRLNELMTRLRNEVDAATPEGIPIGREAEYALSDPHEFITQIMTNPDAQNLLKRTKISPELARDIGIPKWRKATLWEGVVNIIRNALGLGPRDVSAIEAAMSVAEQAMWKRDPGMAMEAGARSLGLRFQRELDPEAAHEDERRMGGRLRDVGDNVARAALDSATNLSTSAQRFLPRLQNGVSLVRSYGHMFTDDKGNILDQLFTLGRRRQARINERVAQDSGLVTEAHVLADQHADHQDAFSNLASDATQFNIRAEETPDEPGNNPEKRAMANWQKNANAARVHEDFNSLPGDLQQHHIDQRQFYSDKSKELAEQHIDMVLDNFPLPAGETRGAIEDRIKNNDLTDADEDHYRNLGVLSEIQQDIRAHSGKTVYFYGQRDGNHVVVGNRVMPDGGNNIDYSGSKLPTNVREFDNLKDAHEFATDTDMHATPRPVYYLEDPKNPGVYKTEIVDPDSGKPVKASADEYDERRYQVALQHEHMEIHPDYASAKRARQAMLDNGLINVSGVLDKRKEGNWGRINTDAGQAMERRIKDRDDLNDTQKQAAIDAARAHALISRSSYQARLVKRRNVAGANYGSADALAAYSYSHAMHTTNKEFSAATDALMKRLEDKDNANRTTDDAFVSSAVANEVRDRVYRSADDMSSKTPPWLRRVMMLSYMRWLFGPRHLMMMQSHPYAYSAPQMAGRHGLKAYSGMHQSAKEMGGDFAGARVGVKATFDQARSLFEKDPAKSASLAGAPDVTADMISRLKDADEQDAMRSAAERNILHTGFGDEFYGASGFKKVDALFRQFTSAQDAQNRAIVWHNAYRLEKAKVGDRAKAEAYADKTVQDTIGVSSPMDMASAMKNPVARTFMQFKSFPVRQIELMARNVYNGFRGESPEVRQEAWKAFAHQTTSAFSMAGAHGLPIGLLKPLGLLGMAMGITPSPSQIDDRMRRGLAGLMGTTGANMAMDGLFAAVPHSPDVSNMFSYDLDTAFGEPRGNDWQSYLVDQTLGASASLTQDTIKGLSAVRSGDWKTAMEKLPAPRILSDILKSYDLSQSGLVTAKGAQLTPASYEDAAWRALGFGTMQQARIYEGREAAQRDIAEAKMTKGEQLKAKQRQKQQRTIMGIGVTPKTGALLRQREEVYQ